MFLKFWGLGQLPSFPLLVTGLFPAPEIDVQDKNHDITSLVMTPESN